MQWLSWTLVMRRLFWDGLWPPSENKLRPRLSSSPSLGLTGDLISLSSLPEHEAMTLPFPDAAVPRAWHRQSLPRVGQRSMRRRAPGPSTTPPRSAEASAGSARGAGDGCDVPALSLQGSGVLYSMSSPHHTKLSGTKHWRLLWSGWDITLEEFSSSSWTVAPPAGDQTLGGPLQLVKSCEWLAWSAAAATGSGLLLCLL